VPKKDKKQVGKFEIINRDVSWLSFNERVLQEASDSRVPLIERLRFLGIFSSNLDEFYRVRVASLTRMASLSTKSRKNLNFDPEKVLKKIQTKGLAQQLEFEKAYNKIIRELENNNIKFINEKELTESQGKFVLDYFQHSVRQTLVPIMLDKKMKFPFLKDKVIYLAIKMTHSKRKGDVQYALCEIPSLVISRFLVLPESIKGRTDIILLDDVLRYCFQDVFSIFDYDCIEGYTIKLTRDAELDIEEELSGSLIEKVAKSLKKRKQGDPVRFIHDKKMPPDLLEFILKKLKLQNDENVIHGGRYHNFKDFMKFPAIGSKNLVNEHLPPLAHSSLKNERSILSAVRKKDVLISFPYQTFNYIIDLLREAAMDPSVLKIQINLYRVADRSKIANALINASKNGKEVVAVVELQARFDEENNIKLAQKLQEEGVKVIFGVNGLKVHSKLILIERKESGKKKLYAHIGTGNFNEDTARLYCDHSLLTSDERITSEVNHIFEFFENNLKRTPFRYLLVSPFNVRKRLIELINEEIRNARRQHEAYIILKLNNLVDEEMIRKLYQASNEGVKIKIIVRGTCSLIPGVKGMSENIEAISIVDRFLEHSRVFIFGNDGHELMFISSADWMQRNLDYRIEVTAPVFDREVRRQLRDIIDMQFKGTSKARIIDKEQTNNYKGNIIHQKDLFRSQTETYKYFKSRITEVIPEK
jgi:polyphosphate kinase